MNKLSLGPIPKLELVRMTITLSANLKSDLDRYSALHGEIYGEKTEAATLIPYIVESFLSRDKEFQRLGKINKSEIKKELKSD